MQSIKKILKKYPLIISFIVLLLCAGNFNLPFWKTLGLTTPVRYIYQRLINIALVSAVILIGAGAQVFRFSVKGAGYAFKYTWGFLLIPLVISLISIYGQIHLTGESVDPHFYIILVQDILLFLLVGLYEESLFRGLFLNALLKYMGETKKGIVWALILSAGIFGFVHVYREFFSPDILDPIVSVNIILKTVQAGILGLALGVIYLRTENLWAISVIHALNNLLADITNILFNTGFEIETYAASGTTGLITIFAYLILIVLMLPALFFVWRQIRYIDPPRPGFFIDPWSPRRPG